MKWLLHIAFLFMSMSVPVAAQNTDVPSYVRKFGLEDRVGLHTEKALTLLNNQENIRNQIIDSTLLVDCGTQSRPSTGFILDINDDFGSVCSGRIAVTAAHNIKMAQDNDRACEISGPLDATVFPESMKLPIEFSDSGIISDQAFDFGFILLPEPASTRDYSQCSRVEIDTAYCSMNTTALTVPQSLGGDNGAMGLSPRCCFTENEYTDVLSSTCKGYYKSSGAPVLKIRDSDVCVAGVYNAYNGKDYGFEAYAASIHSKGFSQTLEAFVEQHCRGEVP